MMILLNYRGKRTWLALLMVLSGSTLIIRSELLTGALEAYYWGSILLIAGVWVNGSFYYFFKKWIHRILIRSTQA